ncbi:MAG: leucine-rich repeat protein [Eubacterium sp.]|nr:leucine-rich repeat protein [Eubacterium sp.]
MFKKSRLVVLMLAVLTVMFIMPFTGGEVKADPIVIPTYYDCNGYKCILNADDNTAIICGRADVNIYPDITIPSNVSYYGKEYSVESIADDAFKNDTIINSLTIEEGVKSIGSDAFYGCTNLSVITIPVSVTIIESGAFSGCSSLTTIHYGGSKLQWAAIKGYGKPDIEPTDYGKTDDKITISTEFYDPEFSTSYSDESGFSAITVNEVTTRDTFVPSDTTATIVVNLNDGYTLTNVNVNDSDDPKTALKDYKSSIDAETGVCTISFTPEENKNYRFKFEFQDAVKFTFDTNGGTTGDDWDGDVRLVSSYYDIFNKDKSEFLKVKPPEGYYLDHIEVSGIDMSEFYLDSFFGFGYLPYQNDVTFKFIWSQEYGFVSADGFIINISSYSDDAFIVGRGPDNKDEIIEIPAQITYEGHNYNVYNIYNVAFLYDNIIKELKVADGVKEIKDYAFCGCSSLSKIELPDDMSTISYNSFLDTAYYNDDQNWYDGALYIGKYLIIANISDKDCIVKEGTTYIVMNAFFNNDVLETISIPASVKSIGREAFAYCDNLSKVIIDDDSSLSILGKDMFAYCDKLTEIYIPASVTEIDSTAFYGCNSLTTIHYGGSPNDWAAITGSGKPDIEPADYGKEDVPTPTPTVAPTPTGSPTDGPSPTGSPSIEPTNSADPSASPEVTTSPEPGVTPTAEPTVSPDATPSVVPTATPSVTPTPRENVTPTPEVTPGAKKANMLKVKAKTATVKLSKLNKKSQKLKVSKVIKFKNKGQGEISYKLSSAKKGKKSYKKYFKIDKKTGKVTVKKGLNKGTYKVKVKLQSAGNEEYEASKALAVTFKIKVK